MEKTQKKYYKSKFNVCVKVRSSQLLWLRKNKKQSGCKTMAGFLDKIMNEHKKTDKLLTI